MPLVTGCLQASSNYSEGSQSGFRGIASVVGKNEARDSNSILISYERKSEKAFVNDDMIYYPFDPPVLRIYLGCILLQEGWLALFTETTPGIHLNTINRSSRRRSPGM